MSNDFHMPLIILMLCFIDSCMHDPSIMLQIALWHMSRNWYWTRRM